LTFPQVRETLGHLAAQAAMVEGMVHGMEAAGTHFGPYYVPNKRLLYAAQVLTQQLYPQVIHAIRELAGGGLIMLPSSVADFANPEIVPYRSEEHTSELQSRSDLVCRLLLE